MSIMKKQKEIQKMNLENSRKKKILYIGESVGQQHSANYIHAQNIARIFEELEYEVIFLSVYGKPDGIVEEIEIDMEGRDYFYICSRKRSKYSFVDKIYIFHDGLQEKPLWKKYTELFDEFTPDVVILYGAWVIENRIIRHAKKNGSLVLIDRTDWFERRERIGFAYKYWVQTWVDLSLKKFDFRASGIIAISDYLVKHYGNKVPVIWIPALCNDKYDFKLTNKGENQLKISYAGIPGSKENLKPIIQVVMDLNEKGMGVELELMGPDESYVNNLLGTDKWKKNGVKARGFISHDEVVKHIANSDMSLLLRYNKKSIKASFSTKFAESMRLGVPVLCTRVGGTDTYVEDMINGFLIDDLNYETIYKKVIELLAISSEKWMKIKNNAYSYAKEKFDYHSYVEEMNSFLNQLRNS